MLFTVINGLKLPAGEWSHLLHHPGRVALLEYRGEEQFTTSLGINLFRHCYAHIVSQFSISSLANIDLSKVIKSLTEHISPSEQATFWLEKIPRNDPGLSLSKCNLRTARFCFEAQNVFDSDPDEGWWTVKTLTLIKEALLIDLEYQEWMHSLPSPWRPRIVRQPSTVRTEESRPRSTFDATPRYVYEDPYVAWASNNCRAARIHLHEVLLHCLSLLIDTHPDTDAAFDAQQTQMQSRSIISEMLSDICASTDFCLGDIDSVGEPPSTEYRMPLRGYLMLWTHWRAYVSAPEESECRLWLRSKLQFISDSMGIHGGRGIMERGKSMPPWDLRFRKS